MKTNGKSRYQIIEGVLSFEGFEIENESVALKYKDNEIELDVTQWFDNEGDFVVNYFEYKGQEAELTPDEQQLIFVRLCQAHKNFRDKQEADALRNLQDAYEREDTYAHINANFYNQY
jgi:hypothetical protein